MIRIFPCNLSKIVLLDLLVLNQNIDKIPIIVVFELARSKQLEKKIYIKESKRVREGKKANYRF